MTPVEVNFRAMPKEGKAGFYGGWPRFMEINGIKIGDVCAFAFKLEKEEEVAPLSVRVRVLRAAPLACSYAEAEHESFVPSSCGLHELWHFQGKK